MKTVAEEFGSAAVGWTVLDANMTLTNAELHAELDAKKAQAQRAVDMLDEDC
jgi:hypothetical protein